MLERQFLAVNESHGRTLPTELFYNKKGLRLWKEITRCSEYCQTRNEIELLQHYGKEQAQFIQAGCMILDMGSG